MGAPFTVPDTVEAIRADLDNLIGFQFQEPDTAKEARRLHERRALYRTFDLAFSVVDPIGLGPLALDVIHDAVEMMDEVDGDADFEPWLAGTLHFTAGCMATALDAEDDSEEDEGTALESYGRGFVRAGDDDAEDDDPAERDDHHGSEDEPDGWRYRPDAWEVQARVSAHE